MTATGNGLESPAREAAGILPPSLRRPVYWGAAVGVLQAASPIGFRWLDQDVVWAMSLAIIAAVYIGFAVADGRTHVLTVEIGVASVFVVIATVAIGAPWLVVVGLVGHGLKDLWQHHTHFVANTRWWPPFCLVVDFVCASLIAAVLLAGVDLNG